MSNSTDVARPLRSDRITKGAECAPHRSLLKATGVRDEDMAKPFVAVVNSYADIVPGHVHLNEFASIVKASIRAAGGVPFEFNTIAVDDGIAMGHGGMKFSLPSRELIADSVETMISAHQFDGMVCIPNCDKIVPGMLMAAMRLDIPTIFVSGGPMPAGRTADGRDVDLISVFEGVGAFKAGTIDAAELKELEDNGCPACGSCSGLFTANSMNCISRGPRSGAAVQRHRACQQRRNGPRSPSARVAKFCASSRATSRRERSLCRRPSMTPSPSTWSWAAVRTRCSTSSLLLAKAGSTTTSTGSTGSPTGCRSCTKISPASKLHMEDLHRAGGIPALLAELQRATGVLHEDRPTAGGPSFGEILAASGADRP